MSGSSTPDGHGGDPEEPFVTGAGPDENASEEPAADAARPSAHERSADADTPPAKEPTPFTQQLGRVFIVILAVLFGIFAVANSQPVDFSWVFGETQVRDDPAGDGQIGGVPLIVLLLITFALGTLIGAFVSWQVTRARRRRDG